MFIENNLFMYGLDIFPSPFDGAKIIINKGLSNHFNITHTVTMSNVQPSGYRFGCTFVGSPQYLPNEVFIFYYICQRM